MKSCFDLDLTKGIENDQIIMAVLQPRYVDCNIAIMIWSLLIPFVSSKSKPVE